MERLPARARTAINGSHTADDRQPWERLGLCLAAAGLAIGLGACEPQSQVSTGTAATPVRATAAPASDAPTVTSAGRIADGTRPSIPPTTRPPPREPARSVSRTGSSLGPQPRRPCRRPRKRADLMWLCCCR